MHAHTHTHTTSLILSECLASKCTWIAERHISGSSPPPRAISPSMCCMNWPGSSVSYTGPTPAQYSKYKCLQTVIRNSLFAVFIDPYCLFKKYLQYHKTESLSYQEALSISYYINILFLISLVSWKSQKFIQSFFELREIDGTNLEAHCW